MDLATRRPAQHIEAAKSSILTWFWLDMPDGLELPSEFLAELRTEPFASNMPAIETARRIEQLARRRLKALKWLESLGDNLAELYLKAVHGEASSKEIEQAADILAEKERASAEFLIPGIERAQQNLAASESVDPELREALRASLDIAVRWLAAYQNTREALLKVAAERRGMPSEVLRARPPEGEIDHTALTREFMARFPRIRAALAK